MRVKQCAQPNRECFSKLSPSSSWTIEEWNKLVEFTFTNKESIIENIRLNLHTGIKRNRHQFFKQMAKFIGSKSEAQCKSKFQKKEFIVYDIIEVPESLLKLHIAFKNERKLLLANRHKFVLEIVEPNQSNKSDYQDISIDEFKCDKKSNINEEDDPKTAMTDSDKCSQHTQNKFEAFYQTDLIDEHLNRFISTYKDDYSDIDNNNDKDLSFYSLCMMPFPLNISVIGIGEMNFMSREASTTQILTN